MLVPSLRRRIPRNRLCSTVFRLGEDVYLVGGYIRDLVLKDAHSKDIDFVVPKSVRPLAASVAEALGGSVVELKKERMTRVALKNGSTLDFSRMSGDILTDLETRDFTINAMAWSPSSGLLDPFGGMKDIERRIIRSLSDENLKRDPLRLLRAYRFQAELGMSFERHTRAAIRRLAGSVKECASERITLEFFKLLNTETPFKALENALSDGILNNIISLKYKVLQRNIKSLSPLESNIKKLHERIYIKLHSQGLTVRGLLRLEALMLGADYATSKLCMSADVRRRLEASTWLYEEFKNINEIDSYGLYDLLDAAADAALDLIILTGRLDLLECLRRFNNTQRRGLITTEEIMTITGVGEGPRLGRIIRKLKLLRFDGKISRKSDARNWLKGLCSY